MLLLLLLLLSLFTPWEFFPISVSWCSLHWGLSDSKSPQVSRTLFSILAVLNNIVVWTISTSPLISKSSSLFKQSFGDCIKSTNHHWYNCYFHVPQFFGFPSNVLVLILLFTFFQFYSVVSWDSKVLQFFKFSFFSLLIIIRSSLLAEIRWSVCISKSQRSLCVSFSRTGAGLSIYHLFVWWNLNF